MQVVETNKNERIITTPAFEMLIRDGISYCVYHKDLVVNDTIAKQMTEARLLLSGNSMLPALVDARQGAYITNSARIFLASSQTYVQVSAMAVLINHHVMNILYTTMLRLKTCKAPIRIFTSERTALEWLEKYKETKAGNNSKRISLLLF